MADTKFEVGDKFNVTRENIRLRDEGEVRTFNADTAEIIEIDESGQEVRVVIEYDTVPHQNNPTVKVFADEVKRATKDTGHLSEV